MKSFDEFFLMTTDDVKRYAVEVLHKFAPDEETECIEIGDGNINYVFKIWSKKDGHSVVVKQADKLLRSSGRPLDTYRNKIEAKILQLESQLAPAYVPEVYHYDEVMCALSMEDISAYKNLRKELMANRVYAHLSENLSSFLADTLLPTTDLVLPSAEKKKNVKFFFNPELCDITEDLVLSEPYMSVPYNERNRNIITAGNEEFVDHFLYNDAALHAEVAKLRDSFMNNAQALIHGDLHSGSVFGNFFFSLASKIFTMPEETDAINALYRIIAETYDMTREKLLAKYDELVSFPLYKAEGFKKHYIDSVMADSVGYAGTEIIRRVVGDSKVMEVTSVTDLEKRIPMERALIKLGIALIMRRSEFVSGAEIIEAFRLIIA